MKAADGQFDQIEQRLKQARLAEPSAEFKQRTLGAAKEAWKKAPADIPWRVPLRHLAVSAAAAVLIVSCANYFSRAAVAPWQAGRPGTVRMQTAHFEDTPEMPYSPFVRHLIATSGAPAHDASALLNYFQSVRKTLERAEPDEPADGSGPGERESRLLPAGSKIDSYV
ncbi:MAG: hypothetical protein M1376_09530 [Planctomycetes bacterium]|nr:hypothetical protein [Planctomycetota bacterium]